MPSNQPPVTVLLDTSPLESGHAVRGIGGYTRWLAAALDKINDITLLRSSEQSVLQLSPQLIHYPFFDFFFPTLPFNLRTPSIVTIHDVIPLLYPDYYKPGLRGRMNLLRQRAALHFAKAIITDSQSSKADIEHYLRIPKEKIHVVYLAGNPDLQAQPPTVVQTARTQLQLPENYVLYVGDINYNKNIPQLIKMLKFLPDEIYLVCVGKQFVEQDIPEWSWIEAQLAMSAVADRVRFITQLPPEATDTLAAVYTGALCYVQPSLYEGFGLPVLEAMQCKTPVVSANTSSLPEVGGTFALFAEPRAESLAQQVEQILEWSKSKRSHHIAAACDWAATFSWQKAAQETAAVYQQVLQE